MPIWFTRVQPTAIAAPQAVLALNLFPNPTARQQVTILYYLPQAETVRVELLDAVGRVATTLVADEAQRSGAHVLTLPMATLAAGLYTLRVVHNGQVSYRKLLVTIL